MSRFYSQDIDANRLAKFLPRPGDGENEKPLPLQWAVEMAHALHSGLWYGTMMELVAIASVATYVVQVSPEYLPLDTLPPPPWVSKSEVAFLVVFGLDLLIGLSYTDSGADLFWSWDTLVKVLSIIPSVMSLAGFYLWGFLRFLRVLRPSSSLSKAIVARKLLCPLCPFSFTHSSEVEPTPVQAQVEEVVERVLETALFVARFIIISAGALLVLDREQGGFVDLVNESAEGTGEDGLSFVTCLHAVTMTLTTVGGFAGGVAPASDLARGITTLLLLVFLPLFWSKVESIIKASSWSSGLHHSSRRLPTGPRERRVLACGSVNADNLRARLKELFHADHGTHNLQGIKVVVLSPEEPSRRMLALLKSPRYRSIVTFVRGSPLDDESLRLVGAEEAMAVMVMANKLARNSHVEDMNTSLRAISVLTHVQVQRRQGGGPKLLVELIDPNAALHLRAAGIRHVVSSDQMKLSVLAQSCMCPGWSAVVANLLQSRATLPPQVLQQGSWLAEYYVGVKKTFFSVEFSPAFVGQRFSDAVANIFELFELIVVAVETRHKGERDTLVLLNPARQYRIAKGDRAFVLAESQADARVVWDVMGSGKRDDTPEAEEAAALETFGVRGIAAMGPKAFVESMVHSKTLLHCQKRLPIGKSPNREVILEWARQFQGGEGLEDDELVDRICGVFPAESGSGGEAGTGHKRASSNQPSQAVAPSEMRVPCPTDGFVQGGGGQHGDDKRVQGKSPGDVVRALAELEVLKLDGRMAQEKLQELKEAAELSLRKQPPVVQGTENPTDAHSLTDPDSKPTPRMDLQSCIQNARHLKGHVVVLGFPPRPSHLECFLGALREGRGWARDQQSTWGAEGGRNVAVVMIAPSTARLASALTIVRRTGEVDTSEVYLIEGSPVSYRDLENAGVKTARAVLVMKDVRASFSGGRRVGGVEAGGGEAGGSGGVAGEQGKVEDALVDSEALVSFIKMEDGLLGPDQHIVVELVHESNVRFLHTQAATRSLRVVAGLGGAGAGGPADEAHYLWPKYSTGMTYSASYLDSLFAQAFYRPSRIKLIEHLLLLNRRGTGGRKDENDVDPSNLSPAPSPRHNDKDTATGAHRPQEEVPRMEAQLRQMRVPPGFLEHSFGELFQHLASPPMCAVAFALRRAAGTRGAQEPYVYTGPRADTVLHRGDRVFVLGAPPVIQDPHRPGGTR
ncbi:unnamed protein product [Discosporangium mesarthrocarpum]